MAANILYEQLFLSMNKPINIPLNGRIVIVTGSNTGLGVSLAFAEPPTSFADLLIYSSKPPFTSLASLQPSSSSPSGPSRRALPPEKPSSPPRASLPPSAPVRSRCGRSTWRALLASTLSLAAH